MSYTVKKGDTLSSIAARYHVSLASLEKANSQIKNPNSIFVGEHVNIPGQKDSFSPPKSSKPAPKPTSSGSTYSVRSGDTMSKIASSHGVSLSALEKANPQIHNFNVISVGERIHIPGKSSGGGSAPVKAPSGGGSAKGTNAATLAKQYLGKYESQLQAEGVTLHCPTNESCADFVSSMLNKTGATNFRTLGVADLNAKLRARGWHVVPASQAKPGDVWICNGAHGESHTELVASQSGGHVTLIGSNNHPIDSNQQNQLRLVLRVDLGLVHPRAPLGKTRSLIRTPLGPEPRRRFRFGRRP